MSLMPSLPLTIITGDGSQKTRVKHDKPKIEGLIEALKEQDKQKGLDLLATAAEKRQNERSPSIKRNCGQTGTQKEIPTKKRRNCRHTGAEINGKCLKVNQLLFVKYQDRYYPAKIMDIGLELIENKPDTKIIYRFFDEQKNKSISIKEFDFLEEYNPIPGKIPLSINSENANVIESWYNNEVEEYFDKNLFKTNMNSVRFST